MVRLYNFLTRKKEVFRPLRKDWVGLYTCGPTVYNYAHIGNLRTYIFEDVLRRTMEYAGYKIKHVMNITDVDDKTIRDSSAAGESLKKFTEFYTKEFFKDLKSLNILPALEYPLATKHIPLMIKLIEKLLEKRLAYKIGGSVYFDVSKFKYYGKLSRLKKRDLKIGARVDTDEYAKKSGEDFVLWKAKKESEPFWDSPFGKGRPGWHIECSAMSMKYLGASFDIHAGGVDLLFPHHENEIAQSQGATGKKFAKYFLEGEHLLVDGKRMAKSAGNFFTLRGLEKKGFNPSAFRYLTLSAHYRSQLNFTWESLKAAENSLKRLQEFVLLLKAQEQANMRVFAKFGAEAKAFQKAIFDDINTPKALAVLWNLVGDYNKNPQKHYPRAVLALLYSFDKILGLKLAESRAKTAPKEVLGLAQKREIARKAKDFVKADEIREKIKKMGWQISDTEQGSQLFHL